jgi:hypothetical protein
MAAAHRQGNRAREGWAMSYTTADLKDILERIESACRAEGIEPDQVFLWRPTSRIDAFGARHGLTSAEIFAGYVLIASALAEQQKAHIQ